MSDSKISNLTAVTTPLAGTEVLPVVQSGTTKKVATDDLTVKNLRSNATTGILQVTGPAAASTRTMTVPDANFTTARTDAAQSFTGDQTLNTGNLVIGTAGKGIDFSADGHASGMTSELLDDYEEGTWIPAYTGSVTNPTVTYTAQFGYYTKIGRMVHIKGMLQATPTVVGAGSLRVSGLPFTSANIPASPGSIGYTSQFTATGYPLALEARQNDTALDLYKTTNADARSGTYYNVSAATDISLSGGYFTFSAVYYTL